MGNEENTYGVEEDLRAVLKVNLEKSIYVEVIKLIELLEQKSFMKGYEYAIQLLQDGLKIKRTK